MDRYELVEGTSSKFWEVSVEGATLTVRFGRIGTDGQSKEKDFADAATATKEKDKLVREKTGKGYALAEAVATLVAKAEAKKAEAPAKRIAEVSAATEAAKSAAAASPQAPPAEPDVPAPHPQPFGVVFDGTPLPTRTRPGRPVDAAEAWREMHELLGALQGVKQDLPPADEMRSPADLGAWLTALADAFTVPLKGDYQHMTIRRSGCRSCLEAAMHWLVQSQGAVAAATLADRMRPAPQATRRYEDFSWADPLHLALRAALVQAPEQDFDAAVSVLNERIAAAPDWRSAAYFAFILADDRPAHHALQPLAVLEAAAAAGVDVGAELWFLPLIVDSNPVAAARWRSKRSYFLFLGYGLVDAEQAAATIISVARSTGCAALPALDWLLYYTSKEERTVVARAILSTREPGALGTLAPVLHEKPIVAALDAAMTVDPATTFSQYVGALASGRTEPALSARVADAMETYGPAVAKGWLREAEPRAVRWLDQFIATRDVALAPEADWPRVLRDPPWRQKTRAKDDIVLALTPIATPFIYTPPRTRPRRYTWRDQGARVLTSMDELAAVIGQVESTPPPRWINIPPASQAPSAGMGWEHALSWLVLRLGEVARVQHGMYNSGYAIIYRGLERQPDPLALALWETTNASIAAASAIHFPDSLPDMMERFGERALKGLVRLVESDPLTILPMVLQIDTPGIAPLAARALFKLKKARIPARGWLREHRATAITRLVPDAVGKAGAARDAAEHALRFFVGDRDDGRAAIAAVVATYAEREPRVAEAVAQGLDRDPLARAPAKVGKLPAWVVPSALARPRLAGGGALPDEAVLALCEMLSFTTPDDVYAGIALVKEACTPKSLAAFAWDLFSAWIAAATPSKDGWALRAVGWFGDDSSARDLTRLIRRWPGESAHQRAVTGLDVLADIGSDVALMNLNGIAEKLKFKGLQDNARAKIAALAEARGLSPEELSDRLAPDLDLDERGGLDLDFGPRAFRAGFDETLKPWVKDASGQRLKDLPKPFKSDDAEKSAAAVARWGALKKDARAVASLQMARLEAMLATSRRVRPEVFQLFFAAHPLVRHLTQRLVWATFADADPRTGPTAVFRVAEDLGFTDAADDPVAIDVSTEAAGLIGLVHPLHLPDGGLTPWGVLFGDYEIAQPFPQLGREVYALNEVEKAAAKSDRFAGIVVEAKRLRGMGARGWPLGSVADHGVATWIEHRLAFADGEAATVSLKFENGIYAGAPEAEDTEQTLGEMTFEDPWGSASSQSSRTFGALDPVTASELLRGPSLLVETRLR